MDLSVADPQIQTGLSETPCRRGSLTSRQRWRDQFTPVRQARAISPSDARPVRRQPLETLAIIGTLAVFAGAAAIVFGQKGATSQLSTRKFWRILLALLAGAVLPVQGAINEGVSQCSAQSSIQPPPTAVIRFSRIS
jgi:hypothetical protein